MIDPTSSATLHFTKEGEFSLSGALTFVSVSNLWRKKKTYFAKSNRIVLDLGKVIHSDSAGLALLVEWLHQAEIRNAIIEFRNIPQQMLSLARTAGIESLLETPEQRN
uniref:Phospholipid transport system transporter-binding protein n=1 Tax=Candidatus Kentrum sp. MB TaxID=2138164 RepID=A0A450XNL7_9GAMM|nr:MAG: phospholipid transport system transporter-binding protein [Candidatus Kentron sp. MB]VFK30844.1 MAG: phospholipid transport system transporter-binding protein [Candidatus Kentron sp. MB]VFK75261.1 MAG: phospholipid transport system transporter-binding protein [Candidatus Kentron sp. MB]